MLLRQGDIRSIGQLTLSLRSVFPEIDYAAVHDEICTMGATGLVLLSAPDEFVENRYVEISQTGARSMLTAGTPAKKRIFIGHGGDTAWKDVRDYVSHRLGLDWDEFGRGHTAGKATKDRLEEMLNGCDFALIVLTAEDQRIDGTRQARENVIHETGLFQAKLGFDRAIILLEDGCNEFSNIRGIGQIRFQKGNIAAIVDDIRKALEGAGII